MTLTDYTEVSAERALGVVEEAIEAADRLLAEVIGVAGDRTYANTLAPLDEALVELNDAFGVGGFMSQVHPDRRRPFGRRRG